MRMYAIVSVWPDTEYLVGTTNDPDIVFNEAETHHTLYIEISEKEGLTEEFSTRKTKEILARPRFKVVRTLSIVEA